MSKQCAFSILSEIMLLQLGIFKLRTEAVIIGRIDRLKYGPHIMCILIYILARKEHKNRQQNESNCKHGKHAM